MLRSVNASLEFADGKDSVFALRDANVSIGKDQFVGVLGPSGSGKSSLLYVLSGMRRPTEGDVFLEGASYREMEEDRLVQLRHTRFGFVFQRHFLIDYLTVLENVLIAVVHESRSRLDAAKGLLERVGLDDKHDRFPHELSGGERQRVAVVRALINQPDVIFADEPTGMLDSATGQAVIELLVQSRGRGSLVVVTHDPMVLDDADQIIRMRDGHVEAVEDRRRFRSSGAAA